MRVLFVCTGNTCRSPMAEGMFRQMAEEAGFAAEVRSAGVAAISGMSISRHAEAVLKDYQIDSKGTSTALGAEDVSWADLILTLTESHRRQLLYAFPEAADKTFILRQYAEQEGEERYNLNFDISDPFGGSRADYDRTATEIRTALTKLLQKLNCRV